MNSRQYASKKHHDNRKMRRQYQSHRHTNQSDSNRRIAEHTVKLTPEHVIVFQQAVNAHNNHSAAKQTAFCVFLLSSLLLLSVATYSASNSQNEENDDALGTCNGDTNNSTTCKIPPASLYNLSIKELNKSDIKDCGNYGYFTAVKTCSISGEKFDMWAIKEKGFFSGDHIHTINVKLREFNRLLMGKIGIMQPEREIFHEPKGYYKSSFFNAGVEKKYQAELYYSVKNARDFVSFDQLTKTISPKENACKVAAKSMREKIGETGIAKLAVASTFMHDVIERNKAWGYSDKGLMILGSDYSPNSIESYSMGPGGIEPGYYSHILYMPDLFNRNHIYFSMDTLKHMEDFYSQLSSLEPPHISANLFHSIRQACEKACHEAILEAQTKYTLKPHEPIQHVNDLLRDKLKHQLLPLIDAATFKSPLQCH